MEKAQIPEDKREELKGQLIKCSWGYNQTNLDLAIITEISDTGKTVQARRVSKKTVESMDKVHREVEATEVYGDKFRLHVRKGYKGEIRFIGQYPFSSGKKEDGTRKGFFSPVKDEKLWETAPGRGH